MVSKLAFLRRVLLQMRKCGYSYVGMPQKTRVFTCLLSIYAPFLFCTTLQANPDVSVNPIRRSTALKYSEEEVRVEADQCDKEDCIISCHFSSKLQGAAWKARVARHYLHKDDSLHDLSIFNAFNLAYWVRRSQVQADPIQFTREGTGKVIQ